MDNKNEKNEPTPPGRYDLFFLTRAHNRGEIDLDEWMRLTREWAEAVIARSKSQPQPPATPAEPD